MGSRDWPDVRCKPQAGHGEDDADVATHGVDLVSGREVAGDLLVPAGRVAVVREAASSTARDA